MSFDDDGYGIRIEEPSGLNKKGWAIGIIATILVVGIFGLIIYPKNKKEKDVTTVTKTLVTVNEEEQKKEAKAIEQKGGSEVEDIVLSEKGSEGGIDTKDEVGQIYEETKPEEDMKSRDENVQTYTETKKESEGLEKTTPSDEEYVTKHTAATVDNKVEDKVEEKTENYESSINLANKEMPDKSVIYFSFDSYIPYKYGIDKIKEFGNLVKNLQGTIYIDGHTDSIGNYEYNKALSEKRANEVKNILIDTIKSGGIDYKITAYGEEKAESDNDTVEGRKLNRRVEIYFEKSY